MSFGTTAASYISASPASGLVQQNSGTWSGITMAASLAGATSPSSVIALIVAGNTVVPTPAGWTLRTSQVNVMGHYLFTRPGGSSSWNVPTNSGTGTWYAAEIGGSYDASVSDNDFGGDASYATPILVPSSGNRLLLASIASVSDGMASVRTVSDWINSFIEVADLCSEAMDYPMQGIATRTVAANGSASYQTSATYSINSTGRSAIIASFGVT